MNLCRGDKVMMVSHISCLCEQAPLDCSRFRPRCWIAILAVLFAACRSPGPPTPKYDGWVSSWLQNPTCRPPCWQSIAPGTTPITATVQVLRAIPGIEDVQGPLAGLGGLPNVTWKFDNSQSGGLIVGQENGIASTTVLSLDSNQHLALEEVLQAYGNPTHVLITQPNETTRYYNVDVIQMQSGLLLGFFLRRSSETSVDVLPDVKVQTIQFFPPGLDSFTSISFRHQFSSPNALIPWRGYSTYEFVWP